MGNVETKEPSNAVRYRACVFADGRDLIQREVIVQKKEGGRA